jgi:multiple sugar transport system ATP-binding protein
MYVETETFSVKIPDSKTDTFKPHDGKSVIFGLRPEDIHDPKYEAPGIIGEQIEGSVEVTELMGNEIFVFLKSGETDYVARIDPRTSFHMGDKVKVTFNMGNMHIFDKETEQAIR